MASFIKLLSLHKQRKTQSRQLSKRKRRERNIKKENRKREIKREKEKYKRKMGGRERQIEGKREI